LIKAKEEFHTRPPIFEYHWRDHPIRSLALTITMCLQPWRLWRWLPLTAVPSVRVMPLLFGLVVMFLALLSSSGEYAWYTHNQLKYWGPSNFQSFQWGWWFRGFMSQVVTPSMLVGTVWLSIQVFRQTIAHYHIRQGHIVRICLFSWIGFVTSRFIGEYVLTIVALLYLRFFQTFLPGYYSLAKVVDAISFAILFLSLGLGFQSYLRVRGGWLWAILLLAFTSTLIVVVGLVVSVAVLDTFDNPYWRHLTDWSETFSILRELAAMAFRRLHGY
jgi:hypothetical protein